MNCADYQRRLAADPARLDPACEAHRAHCADCAALTARAQAFEARLGEALAITPPADFAQTLLQSIRDAAPDTRAQVRSLHNDRGPRPAPTRWLPAFGLAASLLIAVFAGLGAWSLSTARAMPVLAVKHVMGAEAAVLHKTSTVSMDEVVAGFRDRKLALRKLPAGDVTYVHDCVVGGYRGVHLAMRRDNETVTVLYLPGTQRKAGNFKHDGMHVRMVPDAHGTLILLASDPAPFDSVEKDWRPVIDSATVIPTSTS